MLISRNANLISISFRDFPSFLLATRPKTLVASFVPVLVATALAYSRGVANFTVALVCLLCSICLQIATNFINDASDFKKGADTEERLGPKRMAQSGQITPERLFLWGALFLAAAFLLGIYLVSIGGVVFLGLGLAAIVAAAAYTAGPFPLAYHGFGDLFVFLFFGLVAVAGCFYLQAQAMNGTVFILAAMVGLHATSLIAVNNTRDIPTDAKVNKRTISVRLGLKKSQVYFALLMLIPYALVGVLLASDRMPWQILLGLLPLPLAVVRVRQMFRANSGPAYNQLLAQVAQHQLVFTLAVSLGILLGKA